MQISIQTIENGFIIHTYKAEDYSNQKTWFFETVEELTEFIKNTL